MKKFSFGLDTVLNFKEQVLDNLKNEHSQILHKIQLKETVIQDIERQISECIEVFQIRKMQGASVSEFQAHDHYLQYQRNRLEIEARDLMILKRQEKAKRNEVVEAKKETKSIERLKDKKKERYRKEEQKADEVFIEEFVANVRVASKRG